MSPADGETLELPCSELHGLPQNVPDPYTKWGESEACFLSLDLMLAVKAQRLPQPPKPTHSLLLT